MPELLQLRSLIEQGHYPDALVLLGTLDEMSHEDKTNKIGSFIEILLLQLSKQRAEDRTTRSWDVTIRIAVRKITYTNKRRKAGGQHLTIEELRAALDERYEVALDLASLEAFEGIYTSKQLVEMVDATVIKTEALRLLLES
jgi:predicted transcriptional regulator